jgi:hypothetical protein
MILGLFEKWLKINYHFSFICTLKMKMFSFLYNYFSLNILVHDTTI